MKLEKDLYAIDKKLLVKAGDKISRKVLNNISGLSEKIRYVPIKDKWIMKDLINTFKDKRYENILYPPERQSKDNSFDKTHENAGKDIIRTGFYEKTFSVHISPCPGHCRSCGKNIF